MIADRNSGIEVSGNLVGDKVTMGIDAGAMAHIMNILTDLYSDPELAIIREYATNAYDAHIEAGVTRPIEVTTPAPLSPFLRIKDFGVGLTVDDIHEIYSQYGASTKRGTNEQVGMLGLGCKSALTYTSQFTLVSVKDGTRVQVSVSRDDDGGGSMTVVDTAGTSDPDGTEIVIPAKRENLIEAKAKTFFSYWQPGTVLLNGTEPKPVEGLKLNDDLIVVHDGAYRYNSRDQDYVVMGNVAYPCNVGDNILGHGYHVVARVPIGAVNFTPSREALMDTAKTQTTLRKVREALNKEIGPAVQRNIDEAKTAWDALKLAQDFRSLIPQTSQNFKWNGKQMPSIITTDCVLVPTHHRVLSRHQKNAKLAADYAPSVMFIYNYDRPTFTAGQKKKLNIWSETSDKFIPGTGHYALMLDKPDTTEWIDPARFVDWKEIEAIKLPRAARTASGRIPGSYDVWTADGIEHEVEADEIDQTKTLLWWSDGIHSLETRTLAALFPDASVVLLTCNRVEKFKRLFPEAESVYDAVRKNYQKWLDNLTDEQKLALAIRSEYHGSSDLAAIDPSKVDDPELQASVKAANLPIEDLHSQRCSLERMVRGLDLGVKWENPLNKYPLYCRYQMHSNSDHVYNYMNDAYKRSTKEA